MRRAVLAACLLLPLVPRAAEPAPEGGPGAKVAAGQGTAPRDADPGCVPSKLSFGPDSPAFQGTVAVTFQVEKSGSISAPKVTAGDPPAAVAQAIMGAIQACRWIPGTSPDGQPVRAEMSVAVDVKAGAAKAPAAEAPGKAP
jgi:hypothetical protein